MKTETAEQMMIVWREATPVIEPVPIGTREGFVAPVTSTLEPMLTSANLKRLLDTMGQAVLAVDRHGSLFLWNYAAERLFGKPRTAVLHRNIRQILNPGDFLHTLLQSLDHGVEFSGVEVTALCRDKPVTLLVDIRVLRDQHHQPNGGLCVLTDLTSMRDQERRLRYYEQLSMTGKIIAGFAHEVRNPIAAIRGFVQLLLEGRTTREPSTYLNLILEEVDRVNDMIRGFISLARQDGVETAVINPDSLVQDVVTLMQGYTFLNGIDLRTDLRAATSIQGDPDQLKQVLLNLVKNALDATPPGGVVTIATRRQDQAFRLEVRDNGHGIKTADMPKIFDLYFTTHGGTGLGLPISRSIVQQHGGTLTVSSREGLGTTVTVVLPVVDANTANTPLADLSPEPNEEEPASQPRPPRPDSAPQVLTKLALTSSK